ncbi:MAG TPA: rod shape-determining protein MreC [Gaiellaceae bacterium]|nr:rod shape-determining protein MreC [Gaiellaceae bacterium]
MASRDRTARVAVLGSSVRRSRNDRFSSRGRNAMVRRSVLAALVLVALALLTVSFRSPTSGALHDVQGYGATALRPFQVAAERVARPFRDVYGYFDGLSKAKSENARLRREVREWQAVASQSVANERQVAELKRLLHFEEGPTFPQDYRSVNTTVISFPNGPFAQEVTIEAGSSSGIRFGTPVVTADGLIGHVTNVSPHTATVTLLTDPTSAVTARDVTAGVNGLIRHGQGSTLILDQVPKQLPIAKNDIVVTLGTIDKHYPDLYPRGIPIGTVQSVGISDTASYLSVQVTPFARFESLDAVAALVPKNRK